MEINGNDISARLARIEGRLEGFWREYERWRNDQESSAEILQKLMIEVEINSRTRMWLVIFVTGLIGKLIWELLVK